VDARGEEPEPLLDLPAAGLQVKPKTEVSYESSLRNHVLPVFERQPVGSITYRDCKAFVDGLRVKGLAAGTAGEATRKRHPARLEIRPDLLVLLVVGTGVDPVTFRFSGGRSAN
jgi:hypothetical protein